MHPGGTNLDAIAYAEGVRALRFRALKRAAQTAAGKEGDGSKGKTEDEGDGRGG